MGNEGLLRDPQLNMLVGGGEHPQNISPLFKFIDQPTASEVETMIFLVEFCVANSRDLN